MKLDTRKQREREREHLQICEDETTESRTAIASERKSIGNFKKYPKTNKDDIWSIKTHGLLQKQCKEGIFMINVYIKRE